MRSLPNVGFLSPESAGPEESHVSGHCHEQKRSPYHIWHHSDPVVSVAFPVASPMFPGLTGMFALMWMSLQNCKDSSVSQSSSFHVSHNLEASNVLSPEQLQVVTTSSPPMDEEISGVCAAVQDQLERGLAESPHKQQTLHGLPPAWQLTWHAQSTHESHLDGVKGQS